MGCRDKGDATPIENGGGIKKLHAYVDYVPKGWPIKSYPFKAL